MPLDSYFFAAVGLLFALLAVPLMRRRVPPNVFYGLRVPATFRDRSVWYDANAASGRDTLVFGVMLVAAAFVAPAFGAHDLILALVWSALVLGGALLVAGIGWLRANRMLRKRQPMS
jgi:uncharacterized membrane protein